jgi:hypothetical protein
MTVCCCSFLLSVPADALPLLLPLLLLMLLLMTMYWTRLRNRQHHAPRRNHSFSCTDCPLFAQILQLQSALLALWPG